MPCPVSLTRISSESPTRPIQTSTRPLARRELDGVRQQVPEDLLQPVWIPVDERRLGVRLQLEPDPLGLGGGAGRLERGARHGHEVHQPRRQGELARDDTRVVEQVLDQPRLRLGAALDGRPAALPGGLVEALGAQDVHPSHHGAERPPQLVRQRRHELVLDPIGLLRPLPRLLLEGEQRLALDLGVPGRAPVLEGQQQALVPALAMELARVDDQGPRSDAREVVLDLDVLDPGHPAQELVQHVAQRGYVPLPFAQLVDEPADRLLGRDPEVVVEAAVRALHAEVGVQDQQRIAHRLHDPVRVLERSLELEVAALQLLVQRRQLLVARLQLLLRRLQLLVDALQLLVRRKDFLARGLQLLVGRLVLLDHGLEVLRGLAQLAPQARRRTSLGGVRRRSALARRPLGRLVSGRVSNSTSSERPLFGRSPQRHHLQVEPADVAPVAQRHALLADRRIFLASLLDRAADLEERVPCAPS